jgi:hypothetical protein
MWINDLHEPSLPAAAPQNNYPKKKFLSITMMAISIFSRTLVFEPMFSEHPQKPPIKTAPHSDYVAVTAARLPRKPLPQSGTNHSPSKLIKIS